LFVFKVRYSEGNVLIASEASKTDEEEVPLLDGDTSEVIFFLFSDFSININFIAE